MLQRTQRPYKFRKLQFTTRIIKKINFISNKIIQILQLIVIDYFSFLTIFSLQTHRKKKDQQRSKAKIFRHKSIYPFIFANTPFMNIQFSRSKHKSVLVRILQVLANILCVFLCVLSVLNRILFVLNSMNVCTYQWTVITQYCIL